MLVRVGGRARARANDELVRVGLGLANPNLNPNPNPNRDPNPGVLKGLHDLLLPADPPNPLKQKDHMRPD